MRLHLKKNMWPMSSLLPADGHSTGVPALTMLSAFGPELMKSLGLPRSIMNPFLHMGSVRRSHRGAAVFESVVSWIIAVRMNVALRVPAPPASRAVSVRDAFPGGVGPGTALGAELTCPRPVRVANEIRAWFDAVAFPEEHAVLFRGEHACLWGSFGSRILLVCTVFDARSRSVLKWDTVLSEHERAAKCAASGRTGDVKPLVVIVSNKKLSASAPTTKSKAWPDNLVVLSGPESLGTFRGNLFPGLLGYT